jgi:phosphoglycolate phosphatase-like HAD superfamily hydrolase
MNVRRRSLYLFDIDGTLINTGGAGSKAMKGAFAGIWGRRDAFDGIEFSGRTDRAILRDALRRMGQADERFDNPFVHDLQRFKRAYFRRLRITLQECDGRLLPGVVELLEAMKSDDSATVALGTGNFRTGAAMKLRHYRVWDYFCAGGFGDRAESREDMIGEALRACRPFGAHDTVFVIGDTVHDMACAKAHGAVAVGVTTGPADAATLEAAGADVVLETLRDAAEHIL